MKKPSASVEPPNGKANRRRPVDCWNLPGKCGVRVEREVRLMSEFTFKPYQGSMEMPKSPILEAAEKLAENHAMLTEFYLRAWIAETGLKPSECELVVEHTPTGSRTYARKREA